MTPGQEPSTPATRGPTPALSPGFRKPTPGLTTPAETDIDYDDFI